MIQVGERSISIMVLYCVALHIWWAFMIVMDPTAAVQATAVEALYRLIDDHLLLAFLLVFVSCLSMVGMMLQGGFASVLLIPQQVMLMMSAAGAVGAIWLSQFADGEVRPRVFIAADQMHMMFAAIGHTLAIIMHVRTIK